MPKDYSPNNDFENQKPDYEKKTYFLLVQLKEHIVQIESLATYLFFSLAIMYLIDEIGIPIPKIFIILILMIGYKFVMRVTNPNSSIRNRLTWATAIGGFVGVVVGAATDIATGGLTLGQGTLIGASGGAAIGAAFGDKIENLANRKRFLERHEAFDYLFDYRNKHPRLSNPHMIEHVLDNDIPYFDRYNDGRKWYIKDDLKKFVRR